MPLVLSSKTGAEYCLETRDLCKYYTLTSGVFHRKTTVVKAVNGVSIRILRGETLGLVGESGCGKTTLARSILKIVKPTSGQIFFQGRDITRLSEKEARPLREKMQVVFQDPYSSLDPRMRVKDIIGEPLSVHFGTKGRELTQKVRELVETVGLSSYQIDRFPHMFSGGQRQRIAIARALATKPDLVVLDEPTSALDVSIQAQILTLLNQLQKNLNVAYLFISHNLTVVKYMAKRIAVMYRGEIVENADSQELFSQPRHPYTKTLIASIPAALRKHALE